MNNSELQLADQVLDAENHTTGVHTVKQIKEGVITMFRPYTHTADFSYTGGVICYVGIEEYITMVDDSRHSWELVKRTPLK